MSLMWSGVGSHVAQNASRLDRKRHSAIDAARRVMTATLSQKKRKRIEEIFGWLKTIGGSQQTRFRGFARSAWGYFAADTTDYFRRQLKRDDGDAHLYKGEISFDTSTMAAVKKYPYTFTL
jgi:hypothetical protein